MSEPLTCKTAFGTELKHPVAAGLGGPGRTMTVGNRAMRPSMVPFLKKKKATELWKVTKKTGEGLQSAACGSGHLGVPTG